MPVDINNEQLNKELISMDQRLYDLEEKMTSIDSKLTQVVDAILGNPLTKSGGFVDEVKLMKQKIEILELKVQKQEDFKNRVAWTTGIILASLLLIEQLSNLYKSFII